MGNYKKWIVCDMATTILVPGRVAQSVTCLATDGSLNADPGSRV